LRGGSVTSTADKECSSAIEPSSNDIGITSDEDSDYDSASNTNEIIDES
jgi:hypothetical protein